MSIVVPSSNREKTKECFRLDYTSPAYTIQHTELYFNLDFVNTQVSSVLHLKRTNESGKGTDLILDGENLCLKSIALQLNSDITPRQLSNEEAIVQQSSGKLIIDGKMLPENSEDVFKLYIVVQIDPSANTELMGLYKAGEILCTQCEAEGFRRITYFLDRPDVMSSFKVQLEGEEKLFPILLSNGNCIDSGKVVGHPERHFVIFEDPHLKPAYLFALVAGSLAEKKGTFMRSTGEPVRLSLWSSEKDSDKLDWALECLKKAMKWDEEKFGRVYDLNWFNVVAVSFFNMGAMENKSLNIFNTALLLASKDISTDSEFERILSVVGHEYFHNWTGNRVTCRDWFQLTLKEGLTVYRDQTFSSDSTSNAIQRISDLRVLRAYQFPEDAGPMAHPIRPESYQAIDNFYTATVYRKGAEVVRMYATLLGIEGFRKGMDLYFQRHDGQAVTCDDFRNAMSAANNLKDFTQFERWYTQAGTPIITVESIVYNSSRSEIQLTLKQCTSPTPNQIEKKPFHIPIAIGAIGKKSKKDLIDTIVLELTEEVQQFTIKHIHEESVLSILRNYSAPVKLLPYLNEEELGFLMAYDSDSFNSWESGQRLMATVIMDVANTMQTYNTMPQVTESSSALKSIILAFRRLLTDAMENKLNDRSFTALFLSLPDVQTLVLDVEACDPVIIHTARSFVKRFIAKELLSEFSNIYLALSHEIQHNSYNLTKESIGRRRLRNIALSYLSCQGDLSYALKQYNAADNMNDRFNALTVLADFPTNDTSVILANFLEHAADNELVVDKWFAIQAGADHTSVLEHVIQLEAHPKFTITNPNRVRALITRFAMNLPHFHRNDGKGYAFVADFVLKLDKINSRIAARIANHLIPWKGLNVSQKQLMITELQRIAHEPDLSCHVYEIVSKGLIE